MIGPILSCLPGLWALASVFATGLLLGAVWNTYVEARCSRARKAADQAVAPLLTMLEIEADVRPEAREVLRTWFATRDVYLRPFPVRSARRK